MQTKTDKERDGIVGAVESVRHETAQIQKKENKWVIRPRKLVFVTTYDREGKRKSETFSSETYGQSLSEHNVNKQDANGNITEHSCYFDGVLQYKMFLAYDKDNRKIEQKTYKTNGELCHKTFYKYDTQGKIVEMRTYNPDGELHDKHIYTNEYDLVGNLIKVTVRRWTNIDNELIYEPLCEIYYNITYFKS